MQKRNKKPEEDLQIVCAQWFALQLPKLAKFLIHIPSELAYSGSNRGAFFAKLQRLKKMGVRKGTSDFFLAYPTKNRPGFWIEMKVKPNKPSKDQLEFLADMRGRDYDTAICYSLEEFQKAIDNYLL